MTHLVLPTDSEGNSLNLAPWEPIPDDALPAERPDLYGAAIWVAAVYGRCIALEDW